MTQTFAAMGCIKILIFFLSISFCNALFAQDPSEHILDSFSGKFITAIRTHEKQRAYLFTDKVVYNIGGTIWFKAFILNTISQKINNKSGFIFVDLVNEKDSVLKVVILDAANQHLNSRIVLPDNVLQGYYWLRAYTRHMAESDAESMSVKSIYVGSNSTQINLVNTQKNNPNQDSSLIVNFYPEGGTLMTGINSTIALRIGNKNGTPLSINGYLKDSRDTVITQFSTNAYGLGKFDFEPSRNRKYKIIINWHGKDFSYPLPPFNFFAGQLSVLKQPAGYKFRVLLEDSIYRKDFETYLIGISKDSLIFASIGRGQYEVSVDEQKLPEGIATFYLFDKGLKLLSERKIYVHDNSVRIKASTDKNVYGLKEKVTLNLSIADAAQHPITSLITVSAADTLVADPAGNCTMHDVVPDEEAIDNFFLAQNECLTIEEKELFMMVKGNSYQKISNSATQNASSHIDSLLYIKGTVLNDKNEPSVNSVITLLSNSGNTIMKTDTTDNKGRFRFALEDYADSTQFAIEVRDLKGRIQHLNIVLDTIHYPKVNTPIAFKKYSSLQTKDLKKYFNNYYDAELAGSISRDKKSLSPVTLRSRKKINYDDSKRVSASSAIISSDELDERRSVGNAVLSVGGMHILNGILIINGPTAIKVPDVSSEPLLLVDGVKVTLFSESNVGQNSPTLSYLNSLNPKDIDFIEILRGADGANYGVRGGNGVILINLLSTRKNSKADESNLKMFYAKGVSIPIVFPTSDYKEKDARPVSTSDVRSTLFWNGNYLLKDTADAAFTFYTSDIPATYKITITAVTIRGDIVYKTITFRSK